MKQLMERPQRATTGTIKTGYVVKQAARIKSTIFRIYYVNNSRKGNDHEDRNPR